MSGQNELNELNELNEKNGLGGDSRVSVLTMVITSCMCLLPIGLGFVLWDKLPQMIPQQYGWDDQVNWSLPKPWGFILCPALMALTNLALQIVMRLSKKRLNAKLQAVVCWLLPIIALIVGSLMVLKPAGLNISAFTVVVPVLSVMFIMLGNYMPKAEPNMLVGIRAPWINKNPEVWTKTNRLGGFLFVAVGFLNLATCFSSSGRQVFVISVIVVMLVTLVYSLVLAAGAKRQGGHGAKTEGPV